MDRVLKLLKNVKKTPNGYSAQCPSHDDHKNSLDIARGENGNTLINCKAGCTAIDICKKLGIKASDLFPVPTKPRIVATYNYTDESGVLLFQKLRFEPKDFRVRVPSGTDWSYKLNGTRRVLYNLPEVISSPIVFIVEGEKDCISKTTSSNLHSGLSWARGLRYLSHPKRKKDSTR